MSDCPPGCSVNFNIPRWDEVAYTVWHRIVVITASFMIETYLDIPENEMYPMAAEWIEERRSVGVQHGDKIQGLVILIMEEQWIIRNTDYCYIFTRFHALINSIQALLPEVIWCSDIRRPVTFLFRKPGLGAWRLTQNRSLPVSGWAAIGADAYSRSALNELHSDLHKPSGWT